MSDMPTPEALILSPDDLANGSNSKREIKRREALKKAIDVDISSPELTIVDKDFGKLIFIKFRMFFLMDNQKLVLQKCNKND